MHRHDVGRAQAPDRTALDDRRYPSTYQAQSLRLDVPYPDVRSELNRWLPLVKWLLAIPHYIVLVFLGVAAVTYIVIAWFAILFTGRYPRELFDFVVGVGRCGVRVSAYAFLLVTDRYPPFVEALGSLLGGKGGRAGAA